MYIREWNPGELYYDRHKVLLEEAREERLARSLRASHRKRAPGLRPGGFLRRSLWGRLNIPFFRARRSASNSWLKADG